MKNTTRLNFPTEQFFDVVPDLMCITDMHATFLRLNDAWNKIIEKPETQVVNKAIIDFVNPDDHQKIDEGTGIAPDKLGLVFKHFMQEDYITTRKFEGSGLGLSIAEGIVELLGGRIWVESVKGGGSTFWFRYRTE